MQYAKEVVGEWFGIKLPDGIRAFDCRSENVFEDPPSPWGTTLYSSEKAEVDLGLRTQTEWNGTTPLSCNTYIDARKCSDDELRKQVLDMVEQATKFQDEYIEAAKHMASAGQGGSCLYQVVGVALSNFGWSILCDKRTCIVRRFEYGHGYNAKPASL
jgi:hypothetical protein